MSNVPSHTSNAGSSPTKKSEPGLGCLLNGQNEVLFSPRGTFIRELLFDAVWLVLKLMIPTLERMVSTISSKKFKTA